MYRSALVVLCFTIISGGASAQQQVYRYDATTINNSIKCELSSVARSLARYKIDSSRMKAHIVIAGAQTDNASVGFTFGFPGPWLPNVGASGAAGGEVLRGAEGDRNINVDNSINCRKSNVVNVGIRECFSEQTPLFVQGDSVTCSSKTTATGKINASGKVQIWLINVGPSGEASRTRAFTVSLTAPPPLKK